MYPQVLESIPRGVLVSARALCWPLRATKDRESRMFDPKVVVYAPEALNLAEEVAPSEWAEALPSTPQVVWGFS